MELSDSVKEWLKQLEKSAQASPASPDDKDPPMPQGRLFIDGRGTRTAILDSVREAVTKRFPIENDTYRLELKDVKYEGPTEYTLNQQKQALLNNRRLGCSLAGTWRLTDKTTGKILDERRDAVLRVPYYTNRGTIINNGNEYTVVSQARLSPGVYTRRKQNGDLEAQFNVANGRGFHFLLDKSTGRISLKMGQANLPLYPILKALGVTDQQLAKSWGSEVALANSQKNDPKTLQKFYAKIAGFKADPLATPEIQASYIKDELSRFGLDPATVVRTMGLENVQGVTPELLVRAGQKILNINRGIEEPDNRDNPRFSKFYGIEHLLAERISKDSAKLIKPMLFRIGRDKSLARIGRNALNPYIDDYLSTSGLAQPGEEANPMSILIQQSRITRLGEGGISSPDLITPEARGVHGDYLGFIDNLAGPESFTSGVDVRASYGTVLGKDNRLYNIFRNLKTGKKEYVSLDAAADKTVAFPGQDPKAPYLYCMKDGVPTRVKTEDVDYMVPSFARTIGAGINMNPMPTSLFGMRQFYSSKFWEQYLPQKKGELPFVDSLMPDGQTTFSEFYGRQSACATAPFAGTVTKVNEDGITITGKDGRSQVVDLVSNYPHNRLSQFSLFPTVKKGDEVGAGDILAHSNFTDAKTGAFNMGQNLKVAIMTAPLNANSFEDAICISEDAAKRLATSRLYNFDQDTREGIKIGKSKFLAAFPKVFTKEQAEKLDDSGVVKVGTELHRGDPIIAAIGPKVLSAENAQLGKLSSVLKHAVTNKAQTWEHDWPGVVTDVVAGPRGAKVLIKSEPPVSPGDKLCPRGALKGVVGSIVPMDKMPRDAVTNEPYDMLVNPMGFLSRVAPGQLMEIALGKVAKKTGKQIRVPQLPPPEGWLAWTRKQLADAGVQETADVFDPQTGRTIKGVGDGYMYVQAMHHLAEKKFSARGIDGSYTQDQQPAKGGMTGAKKISGFDDLALLSHGATEVLKDSMTIRGQSNQEYWRKLRLGLPIPEPDVPFIYTKFLNNLRAGGINVVEKGDVTSLMPQTDKAIEELAGGRIIDSAQMVDYNFDPVKGGLFDLAKTGGMGGNRWAMIELHEPVPNPVMEEPVRRVLGLTVKGLKDILSGKEELNGKTGGAAIKDALSKLDTGRLINQARSDIKTKRGSARDNAVKILGYLTSAEGMKMKPSDWMITKVPVLPPAFRPITKAGDTALVPDTNELYKELLETKHNYEILKDELPASALTDERLNVYKAVKAAFGLGDSVTTEGQAKNLKGPIRQVIGTIPKCYDDETEILTSNRRWINISELRKDDIVATVNPKTQALEWQKPDSVIHTPYTGCMVHTFSKKIDILVTPNHDHYIEWRKNDNKFAPAVKTEAAELLYTKNRGRMLTAPSGGQRGAQPRAEFGDLKFKDLEALSLFLGMYLAEGWIPRKDETSTQVTICQSPKSEHVKYIDEFCSRLGVPVSRAEYVNEKGSSFSHYKPIRCIWWTITNKEFAQWTLANFGAGSEAKFIGDEILSWDNKYLRKIVEAYLRGDGEHHETTVKQEHSLCQTYKNRDSIADYGTRAATASKNLADDMSNLCMRIGLGFRLTNMVEYDNPKWNTTYRFSIDGWNKVVLGDSGVTTEWSDYFGKVHCCTVPNGILVLRRHGCTFVSGNCGQFQSKVIAKNQDVVGRSVTVPDKNLELDQIGIPEEMAWSMYKPFVTRGLTLRGYSPVDSLKMIDDRTPTARHVLREVMERKPVLMDRAPTWHKFNIMAFKPFLVPGNEIHVCPMIDSGYNMDHDGDQVNIHVPASEAASKEALEKMLPSRNLFSLTDLKSVRYKPEKEQISGLWALTSGMTKKAPRIFASKAEAIKAYRNGEIGHNDPIEIRR